MSTKYICIVCHNNNVKYDASSRAIKTFHSIPTSPRRREAWLKNLNLEDAKITSRSKVCELHFSKSQYVRTRIKKDAVPSLTARPRNSGSGVAVEKSVRPSKSLGPLYLLTQVTPVPVLQLAPGQSTSAAQLIPSSLIPPQAVPSPSTPGGTTAAKGTSSTNEGPDTIPLPLRQLLQESLKKEVADKVLEDAPSARSFCEKILTEVESWIKSQKLLKRPEKPGQQEQVRAGINELEKQDVDGEEEDESAFLHPAKVECKDDPLGGDVDDDNLSDSRAQEFLKMEWHDESAEAQEPDSLLRIEEDAEEVDEKESDTDEGNESVLGL